MKKIASYCADILKKDEHFFLCKRLDLFPNNISDKRHPFFITARKGIFLLKTISEDCSFYRSSEWSFSIEEQVLFFEQKV